MDTAGKRKIGRPLEEWYRQVREDIRRRKMREDNFDDRDDWHLGYGNVQQCCRNFPHSSLVLSRTSITELRKVTREE